MKIETEVAIALWLQKVCRFFRPGRPFFIEGEEYYFISCNYAKYKFRVIRGMVIDKLQIML